MSAKSVRRVFAIADTHLGEAMGKTMDRFGPRWVNHKERLLANAAATVGANDILLIAGDLSWALKRKEAEPDLAILAALPGTKVLIKGNHDYWWESGRPLNYPGLLSPPVVLDDNSGGKIGIAGTRGWFVPTPGAENEDSDRKILERERGRLLQSLRAIADCSVKIAMTHYPPHPYLNELRDAGVSAVVYGHVHFGAPPDEEKQVHDGAEIEGVRLYCVAGDRVDFTPRELP
jgi:uncharacterized protein